MKSRIEIVKNYVVYKYNGETLRIDPWGENGFRVRSTHMNTFSDENWALLPQNENSCEITDEDDGEVIKNGRISARISQTGVITFLNCSGQILLEEYVRNHGDVKGKFCAIDVDAREFRAIPCGDYHLTMHFESVGSEKIYGMGQYQIPYLDLKNSTLELAARNSQISVPFMISSLGYGFLWNNPAIGCVSFSKNLTEWVAESTRELDYWITAGNTPAEIEQEYAAVTGTVPMMPEYAMGFWQCKLRYQMQAELLEVAREYKRRSLPISVIVADFFHWTNQGEWKFDPQYWPDPAAMVQELDEMGIKLMVSVWPTVDKMSENYQEMLQKGYLVKSDSGMRTMSDFLGNCIYYDATNPDARRFLWSIIKKIIMT